MKIGQNQWPIKIEYWYEEKEAVYSFLSQIDTYENGVQGKFETPNFTLNEFLREGFKQSSKVILLFTIFKCSNYSVKTRHDKCIRMHVYETKEVA